MTLSFNFSIRLLQRYQNVKAELEAQQNLERVRMEKLVQTGLFITASAPSGNSSSTLKKPRSKGKSGVGLSTSSNTLRNGSAGSYNKDDA